MTKRFDIYIKIDEFKSVKSIIKIESEEQSSLHFSDEIFGDYVWKGNDILECFNQLRKFIESKGFLILVNGTRKNTWASGGLRDSSNGELTYLLGKNSNHTILNIFDYSDKNNVTYEEHIKYYKDWLRNLK